MPLTPFFAVIASIAGEVASLNALYTGHPTSVNGKFVIAALITMTLAMVVHPMTLLFGQFATGQTAEPESTGTDPPLGKQPN